MGGGLAHHCIFEKTAIAVILGEFPVGRPEVLPGSARIAQLALGGLAQNSQGRPSLATVNGCTGGYWEDQGYNWSSGS